MTKLFIRIALLAGILAAAPARAGFGMPSAPKMPSGGGASVADVDGFIAAALESDALVRDSSILLGRAVIAKDRMEAITAKFKAAAAATDPQEKAAKTRDAQTDLNAELVKTDFKAVCEKDAAAWDDAKKQNVADALYNLSLGLLKDSQLVTTGKNLVSGPPNPAIAARLPLVKDTVAALAGQVDSLGKLVGSTKDLVKVVKLDKLPGAASEPPKKVESFL
jgi:hypothetical protein